MENEVKGTLTMNEIIAMDFCLASGTTRIKGLYIMCIYMYIHIYIIYIHIYIIYIYIHIYI